ncbi:ATP-binding protein [Streptomyces sp. NPDC050704]|uniref:ATP-binding protein n=1 Tax=Streptomyces sp. NPDC050704 TaxID=3157219 RepID=UPI003449BC9C
MSAPTPQATAAVRTFAQRLSSTRRGARLARLLAVERLQAWQVSLAVTERVEHVVAELAANAALHGRVEGRDFQVALTLDEATGTVRVSVTDVRGDQLPLLRSGFETSVDDESGRGLLLVTALADRWGTDPYPPSGKTIWAEIDQHGKRPEAVVSRQSGGRCR